MIQKYGQSIIAFKYNKNVISNRKEYKSTDNRKISRNTKLNIQD